MPESPSEETWKGLNVLLVKRRLGKEFKQL